MKPIWIIKAGETLADLARTHGDFEDWIAAGLAGGPLPVQVHDARAGLPPAPDAMAGAIVTGSHAMVSERAGWSEALAAWLRDAVAAECPVLGICYGHQLLAHALGGEVGYRPQGPDVGTVNVERYPAAQTDPLFGALPARFAAPMVHLQSVVRLPSTAVALAHHAQEPHAAFRVGPCAWGVQFHPEFSLPAVQAYVDHLAETLRQHGMDPASVRDALQPTPHAAALLPAFADWAAARAAR